MRAPLPIDPILPDVTAALRGARGVVVVAPPGSGKTTRIPPALLDSIDGQILVLEPRRVAVRAAARRMADEGGWALGREVGYQIRFERRASAATRILVVTEGTAVRMLQDDPFLDGVGGVLV
ncbi:MAG: ATP-dependent helicase HrpB, partial [Myxococcota bacterium]|nr:ATP-dependent helicase HrpB [Myxococcota bacterium]